MAANIIETLRKEEADRLLAVRQIPEFRPGDDLGAAIAADPNLPVCVASRMWNWAMSRGDVVNDGSAITDDLATSLTTQFVADNYNMKKLVRRVFTDPTFVRY